MRSRLAPAGLAITLPWLGISGLYAPAVLAEPTHSLSAGVWANYRYVRDDDRDEESWGDIADEALILYADGHAGDDGHWSYSAELRIGPGSFTDPANNSTGDSYALHKAWVGWQVHDTTTLRFGKSQVPFGWKTVNFWPGDILLAGYGDQMDVGVKLSSSTGPWRYDLAYYHADDWGERSTDTVDDNGHWGSSNTFRKVQTLVANGAFEFAQGQRLAVSVQTGQLQDLSNPATVDAVDGDHLGYVLWYHGQFGDAYAKLAYIGMERELPTAYRESAGLPQRIENTRLAAELGYRSGDWFFYLDASLAEPDTAGNSADRVSAYAPGLSYHYGPGWIYVEMLSQDGFVDRDGQIGEGDFDALYLSVDFYL